MSIGLEADLCPASVLCPVSGWQNSVQRRGMPSDRVAELCQASGKFPVPRWQTSLFCQGYVEWHGRRAHFCDRVMSSGLEVELCSASGVFPLAWRQNSFLQQGISTVQVAKLYPSSEACPMSE
ncbi:hypothetical protein TNCV_4894651 [Trichonephila clavipes]|nr:hypothetical protein TNCV_4894651 [Trichonephila clavipes]